MAMKRGALLLITVFLATASLSLAYSSSSPKEKLDECLDRCQGSFTCVGQCGQEYYKEMESQDVDNSVECQRQCRFEPREQRRPCEKSCEAQKQSRWDRFERCQKRCSDLGFLQQLPCQTRCATEFGFRGQNEDANTMLEQCQRQCQFKPMRQQPPCFRSCDAKFPQQDTKWEKLEECQRKCSQSRMGIFGQGSCQAKCASEFGFGQ